jgi:hypothetical protein
VAAYAFCTLPIYGLIENCWYSQAQILLFKKSFESSCSFKNSFGKPLMLKQGR